MALRLIAMFTGIIKDIGTVLRIDRNRGDARYVIRTGLDLSRVEIGASIACGGCCLTVVEKDGDCFLVDVSAETLSKTKLGSWNEGARLNIEPSLRIGDELGGHIVSGHVDGLARIVAVRAEGDSHRLSIEVPQEFARFIAPKGSVALDGISLTVNEVEGCVFGVNIIPHTWQVTTLGDAKIGDVLNFEIDLMARYAARLIGADIAQNTAQKKTG